MKEKKFYWSTGVTRSEVIQSLNDTRHSVFWVQSNRRWLVTLTALALFSMACVLFAYVQLRKSVRNVADAPDELLDERQIAVRDAGYLHAYRYLSGVGLVYVGFYFLNSTEFFKSFFEVTTYNATQLVFSYCMFSACLPSMVLAWLMPSENQSKGE
jgi:hypothetical protein